MGKKRNNHSSRTLPRERPSPRDLRRAIRGSNGSSHVILSRLGVPRSSSLLRTILDDPSPRYHSVRRLYQREVEAIVDDAEDRLRELLEQDDDRKVAITATKFVLEKRRAKLYGPRSTVVVEGGEKPLVTEQRGQALTPEAIRELPVAVRRELLRVVDKQEQQRLKEEDGGR